MSQFKEQIDIINPDRLIDVKKILKRINPGRLIDTTKTCPLIKDQCIKSRCNAYQRNMDINYVSQSEIDKYIEDGHNTDWKENIEKDGWKLYRILQIPRLNTLDDFDYIFIKESGGSESETIGRCNWGYK